MSKFEGKTIAEQIVRFYHTNHVRRFMLKRPFHRGQKNKENEYKVCLSVCLSTSKGVSICLCVHLSVCLSVCLCVCVRPSVHMWKEKRMSIGRVCLTPFEAWIGLVGDIIYCNINNPPLSDSTHRVHHIHHCISFPWNTEMVRSDQGRSGECP